MSSLHLSMAGLDALQRGYAQAPEVTRRELLAAMTQGTLLVEREVKDGMPRVSGLTAASVASDAFSTPVGVIGTVGSSQPSATKDSVAALDKQYQQDISALDQTLATWREQIDISRGIDVSVLSVRDAVDRLATSLLTAKQTSAAATAAGSLAAYAPEQVVGAVDYVRNAGSRGDVMAVYQGAAAAGLNVDQLTAVASLAGYQVGADEIRAWIDASGLPALPEAPKKFALGGAFMGGGVVHRPTYFDMGLMGEAGAEAIVPLANAGGKLGINAAGLIDSQSIVAAIATLQVQMEQLIAAAMPSPSLPPAATPTPAGR